MSWSRILDKDYVNKWRQLLFISMLISLLFISGCTKKWTENKFIKHRENLENKAISECVKRDMDFISLETKNFQKGISICMTKSPPKIYRYEVNND